MCQFIESIKIENKKFQNLEFHQKRLTTVFNHYFKNTPQIILSEINVPEHLNNKVYKCRLTYAEKIINIEFEEYVYRNIKTLKIIEDNNINYSFKFANRTNLDKLRELRGIADDIIIIKNGFVTDSSYCNLLFYKNKQWYTPDSYLLAGTMRAKLLKEKKIIECKITKDDIFNYEKIKLINCFNDITTGQEVNVLNITS